MGFAFEIMEVHLLICSKNTCKTNTVFVVIYIKNGNTKSE